MWAAKESILMGYGWISIVSEATSISKPTIVKRANEINNKNYREEGTCRQRGGRKDLTARMPDIS